MGSLVDDLNALLVRERGIVEAAAELVKELDPTDPDIADSIREIEATAAWACQGLYHRIVQLGGIATQDTGDLAERVSETEDTPAKINLICRQDVQAARMVRDILHRGDVDGDTKGFLDDMLNARRGSVLWCRTTLDQWKVDSADK